MTANIIHLADRRPKPKRASITPMPGDSPAVLQKIARLAEIEAAPKDVDSILAAYLIRLEVRQMRDYGPRYYRDNSKP